jgi:hypothetical protein
VAHGSLARYVDSGHLVVARGGGPAIVPFDAKRLQTTGTPIRMVEEVMQSAIGASQVSVSRTGSISRRDEPARAGRIFAHGSRDLCSGPATHLLVCPGIA